MDADMNSASSPGWSSARASALRAVRARDHGRDVDAIRDDLRGEFAARGVEVSNERLDYMAEEIARSYGFAGPFRLFGDSLAALGKVWRVMRESGGPDWLQPPKGNYPRAQAFYNERLEGVDQHKDLVARVYKVIRDDEDEEVVVCTWLSIGRDAAKRPNRVQVNVGNAAIGYVSKGDFSDLYRLIETAARRGRVIWVDSFIVPDQGSYTVDVKLPARE